jgi:hypothetical protein
MLESCRVQHVSHSTRLHAVLIESKVAVGFILDTRWDNMPAIQPRLHALLIRIPAVGRSFESGGRAAVVNACLPPYMQQQL